MTIPSSRAANYAEFCEKLAAEHQALPKRLAQTARYLLSHPDEVAFGTTSSIAEAAGVQPSTLIRFAKANGFDGFSELQTLFREKLRYRDQSYLTRLGAIDANASDPVKTILTGFIAAGQQSLEALSRELDVEQFEAAVELLGKAETIYLVGRRRAFPPLVQLRYAFAKLGLRSEICGSSIGIDTDLLTFARPADAAIIISFAPYSDQALEADKQLCGQQVPVLAITDTLLSPIVANSAARILLNESDFAGFRTSAAAMTLVMALSVAIAEKRRLRSSVETDK
ncbi:MurR/RpiR family transcriptional regulator [Paracoccus aerodenitrificans]|uniref:MurR/RpiR family transcriptional regulator n=1 Tax=Paracoccus aerodenitrificans TaxID=3017781 RepID=UPI0022F0E73B|nr:MurR/RpiR family transcriptional regulator [Paracoccus aerodenitrificans]WBU62461.1 MurR/RpiR family transcriptional regulator [Paracoccus aerodenitrificans]